MTPATVEDTPAPHRHPPMHRWDPPHTTMCRSPAATYVDATMDDSLVTCPECKRLMVARKALAAFGFRDGDARLFALEAKVGALLETMNGLASKVRGLEAEANRAPALDVKACGACGNLTGRHCYVVDGRVLCDGCYSPAPMPALWHGVFVNDTQAPLVAAFEFFDHAAAYLARNYQDRAEIRPIPAPKES